MAHRPQTAGPGRRNPLDVLSAPEEISSGHPSAHNVLDRVNEVERVLAAALRAGKPWWAEEQKNKQSGLQSFELEGVYKRLNSLEDMVYKTL
jgi:hypothetical protein